MWWWFPQSKSGGTNLSLATIDEAHGYRFRDLNNDEWPFGRSLWGRTRPNGSYQTGFVYVFVHVGWLLRANRRWSGDRGSLPLFSVTIPFRLSGWQVGTGIMYHRGEVLCCCVVRRPFIHCRKYNSIKIFHAIWSRVSPVENRESKMGHGASGMQSTQLHFERRGGQLGKSWLMKARNSPAMKIRA